MTPCRFCIFPVTAFEAVYVGSQTAHPDCAARWWRHVADTVDRKDALC